MAINVINLHYTRIEIKSSVPLLKSLFLFKENLPSKKCSNIINIILPIPYHSTLIAPLFQLYFSTREIIYSLPYIYQLFSSISGQFNAASASVSIYRLMPPGVARSC